ncbi:hypothetical protein QL285_033431 [Trifolium repens]|nr:hypothetical protein QL285_033431 [Trifolium repens]
MCVYCLYYFSLVSEYPFLSRAYCSSSQILAVVGRVLLSRSRNSQQIASEEEELYVTIAEAALLIESIMDSILVP